MKEPVFASGSIALARFTLPVLTIVPAPAALGVSLQKAGLIAAGYYGAVFTRFIAGVLSVAQR